VDEGRIVEIMITSMKKVSKYTRSSTEWQQMCHAHAGGFDSATNAHAHA
jgi:hypothetical protein